jgi:hypothetical protein
MRVNMESSYGGMSTRLKQRAVTEILSAENVSVRIFPLEFSYLL